MRTLFLNPPSYDDFDGGAGSRYQAKREVWSFWYPTWLCYPAGMLPGARVLDALPFVTEVYERDLDYLKYNSPYCQYPYVSLYTGRGCPARCTFCLWPQVTTGHTYRVRSVGNVLDEVSHMKRRFPKMKELFFDDDTFTADPPRAREIAQGLGRLGITWSTNSRANVDRETLKVLKDGGP